MNKNTDNTLSIEQFKKNVQNKFFSEYKKLGYKLGQVYDIEAKKNGFENWHHMLTTLNNKEKGKQNANNN